MFTTVGTVEILITRKEILSEYFQISFKEMFILLTKTIFLFYKPIFYYYAMLLKKNVFFVKHTNND